MWGFQYRKRYDSARNVAAAIKAVEEAPGFNTVNGMTVHVIKNTLNIRTENDTSFNTVNGMTVHVIYCLFCIGSGRAAVSIP